jgi:hypothetical protein
LDVRFDTLLGERSDLAGSAVASIVGIPEELLEPLTVKASAAHTENHPNRLCPAKPLP